MSSAILARSAATDTPTVSGCNEVIYEAVLTIGLIAPMKSEITLVKWIALSGNCIQEIQLAPPPRAARLFPQGRPDYFSLYLQDFIAWGVSPIA